MPHAQPWCERTVVIVEDDPDSRDLLGLALEQAGFAVRAFESAEDALVAIGDEVPALVITDLTLSGIDGAELVRQLRGHAQRRSLNAIALTGWSSDKAAGAGPAIFSHVFTKPVDCTAVIDLVKELLHR